MLVNKSVNTTVLCYISRAGSRALSKSPRPDLYSTNFLAACMHQDLYIPAYFIPNLFH